MMPTARLALAVVVAACITALAALGGWGGVAALLSMGLLALVGVTDLARLWRLAAPRVHPRPIPTAWLRRPVEVSVDLVPRTGLVEAALGWPHDAGGPVSRASIQGSGRAGQARWTAVPRRRGTHGLGPLWLRAESPLGLWARRFAYRPGDLSLSVLPDLHGPANDSLGREIDTEGEQAVAGALPEAGSELRGLRPFQTGDDPRHVDWKATARSGHPVVREWEPDRRRAVLFALDAGRLMRAEHDGESKFDAGLRALARVAMAAEARGDAVGLVIYADRVLRYVPPLTGPGRAYRLLRFVGELEPVEHESELVRAAPHLLRQSRRSLVVVITDVLDATGANALTQGVMQLAKQHLPVVALLRDPHLDEALSEQVDRAEHAYVRAAAELAARERSQAVANLRARGVQAMDVSMRGLALEVVQRYVDARWRRAW